MIDFENNNNNRRPMRLHLVPPDDTDMSATADDEDTLSSMSTDDDFSQLEQNCQHLLQEEPSAAASPPVQSFICPLTMDIMFDPVVDNEGNSFERTALLDWLNESGTSPISHQPLCKTRLIPNTALRQIIHDVMGPEWVSQKTKELQACQQVNQNEDSSNNNNINKDSKLISTTITIQSSLLPMMSPPSLSAEINNMSTCWGSTRARINFFLKRSEKALGIPNLALNKDGCCAFQQGAITIILDVPDKIFGVFGIYTADLLPTELYLDSTSNMESIYRTALEMNYLQSDTRGGCLSIRHNDDCSDKEKTSRSIGTTITTTRPEILFSYTDRVCEIGAQDFSNILLNFVDTAKSLRERLVRVGKIPGTSSGKYRNNRETSSSSSSSSSASKSQPISLL